MKSYSWCDHPLSNFFYIQSRSCIISIQVWSPSQALQNHPLSASVGTHAGSHAPGKLDPTSVPCCHTNIRLPDEAATSTCILGRSPSRCYSGGHQIDQGGRAEKQKSSKIERALLREYETCAVQTRCVLQGDRIPAAECPSIIF